MSLDETYEALQYFDRELRVFDERLKAGHAEVRRLHSNIDGLWRDSLRKNYDLALGELEENIDKYANADSELFEDFMRTKLSQLRHYLYGS